MVTAARAAHFEAAKSVFESVTSHGGSIDEALHSAGISSGLVVINSSGSVAANAHS